MEKESSALGQVTGNSSLDCSAWSYEQWGSINEYLLLESLFRKLYLCVRTPGFRM